MGSLSQVQYTIRAVCWDAMLISSAILMSAVSSCACTCSAPPVEEMRRNADVVFRGTIVALRPSGKPVSFVGDTGKIAVFKVNRVWKGDIGSAFEMAAYEETGACWGFWPHLLKIGNDLVVFAFQTPGGDIDEPSTFQTTICSRTAPATANKDLDALGPGYEPSKSPEAKERRSFYSSVFVIVVIGSLVSYAIQRRLSSRSGDSVRLAS